MDLLVAPFAPRIVFVQSAKLAIIALVERLIPSCLGLATHFFENQLQGMLSANKVGREGPVEGKTARLEEPSGSTRFFNSFVGENWIFPACEKVLEVPLALAVAYEHENAIHFSTLLDFHAWRR